MAPNHLALLVDEEAGRDGQKLTTVVVSGSHIGLGPLVVAVFHFAAGVEQYIESTGCLVTCIVQKGKAATRFVDHGTQVGGLFGTNGHHRYTLGLGLQSGRPTTLNLLLVGDNDIGSLNSNFSLRYLVHEKWQVQAGYQFLFTEFTTKAVLANDNDRFRRKSGLLMLGVQYRL